MSGLAEIERAFQAYLLTGDAAILPHLRGNARVGAPDLLAVYGHAYRTRLMEALANDFPGLHGLLGADDFAALAGDYLAAHPSQFPSLRWLGRDLPEFLDRHPHPAHPLAADMARFDWAVAHAFDARDQVPVTLADLVNLPAAAWESFRLVFAASVVTFPADAATGDCRQGILRDRADRPAAVGISVVWLVWRQDDQIQFRPCEADEIACLDHMRAGGGFGTMCEILAGTPAASDPVPRSAGFIKDWIERGLVVGIEHDAAASS